MCYILFRNRIFYIRVFRVELDQMLLSNLEGSSQCVPYRQALWRGYDQLKSPVTHMIGFYATRVGSRQGCCFYLVVAQFNLS